MSFLWLSFIITCEAVRKPRQRNIFEMAAGFYFQTVVCLRATECESELVIPLMWPLCAESLFHWQRRVWSGICRESNQRAAAKHWAQIAGVIPATQSCASLKVAIKSGLNCAAAEHRAHPDVTTFQPFQRVFTVRRITSGKCEKRDWYFEQERSDAS